MGLVSRLKRDASIFYGLADKYEHAWRKHRDLTKQMTMQRDDNQRPVAWKELPVDPLIAQLRAEGDECANMAAQLQRRVDAM